MSSWTLMVPEWILGYQLCETFEEIKPAPISLSFLGRHLRRTIVMGISNMLWIVANEITAARCKTRWCLTGQLLTSPLDIRSRVSKWYWNVVKMYAVACSTSWNGKGVQLNVTRGSLDKHYTGNSGVISCVFSMMITPITMKEIKHKVYCLLRHASGCIKQSCCLLRRQAYIKRLETGCHNYLTALQNG